MKLRALLACITGVALLGDGIAGDWCPPEPEDKCPIECCPDPSGSISAGYDTDYIWKGIRWARDNVWADVNYTFDKLPLSPNIGVWHLSSLGSWDGVAGSATGSDNYGDEFNLYGGVDLPSICGFDHGIAYTWYAFPTTRFPSGTPGNGGDSLSALTYTISRELFCGVSIEYSPEWFFGLTDQSDWFHTIGLSKSFDICDCIALDVSASVSYNDGLFAGGSGWHNYGVTAALPIAIAPCATLTPHLSYNGTPDGWIGDGFAAGTLNGLPNENDVLYGGVSISVDF